MYPNLHSTMYLFQLTVIVHCSFSSCIYIPLCIYFNRRNCCINSAFISIYIPLCIYFNDSGHSGGGGSSRFTFHYVSISTESYLNRHTRENIYIPLCIYFNHCLVDKTLSPLIYIPLCIYFNLNRQYRHYECNPYLHSTMYLFQRRMTYYNSS